MKSSVTGGVGQAGSPSTQVNENPSIDENSSANRTDQNKPTVKPREKDSSCLEWQVIPTDIIFQIFDSLMQQIFQGSGQSRASALNALVQFGSTSVSQFGHLQEFLKNYPDVNQLRTEIETLRRSEWRQQVLNLRKNSEKLRDNFSTSASMLAEWSKSFDSSNSSSAVVQPSSLQGLDQFEGVQINCKIFHWKPEMKSSISVLEGKVVKLDAKAIGRERFHNEILPTLNALPANCCIVLDLSNSGLLPEDLGQLVELMKVKPTIYRLDLSENPVVVPNVASIHIANLFTESGPLTHLYLENTGFNDATAQSLKNILPDSDLLEHLDLRGNPLSETGLIDIIRGTFDPTIDESNYAQPLPRLAHSLRAVRLPGGSHSFGDDLRDAVNSFTRIMNFFQIYQMMRSGEFGNNSDGIQIPDILEVVDPRPEMDDDSARIAALNNFYQARADKDRL